MRKINGKKLIEKNRMTEVELEKNEQKETNREEEDDSGTKFADDLFNGHLQLILL